MSEYLIIKKDGVLMGSWCKSSKLFEMTRKTVNVPYGVEQRFDAEDCFTKIVNTAKDCISQVEKSKKQYEKLLNTKLSYEEKLETLDAISELEEEIIYYIFAMHQIQFMLNSYEDSKYYDDEDKDKDFTEKNIWTWYID